MQTYKRSIRFKITFEIQIRQYGFGCTTQHIRLLLYVRTHALPQSYSMLYSVDLMVISNIAEQCVLIMFTEE